VTLGRRDHRRRGNRRRDRRRRRHHRRDPRSRLRLRLELQPELPVLPPRDHHRDAQASGERSHHIQRHVTPLLPKLRSLHIDNAGKFLFSRPSRELLQSIDPVRHGNLKIDLISNGTLFTEREWQKFANIHGLVRTVRISTDAATKETFELLRRGARWDAFWRT
jgi:hypothetical protein